MIIQASNRFEAVRRKHIAAKAKRTWILRDQLERSVAAKDEEE